MSDAMPCRPRPCGEEAVEVAVTALYTAAAPVGPRDWEHMARKVLEAALPHLAPNSKSAPSTSKDLETPSPMSGLTDEELRALTEDGAIGCSYEDWQSIHRNARSKFRAELERRRG